MAMHYAKALEAVKSGDRVAVHHPDPMKPAEAQRYWLVRAERSITSVAFRKMLPDLRPVPDGLFGAEISQTYEWSGGP